MNEAVHEVNRVYWKYLDNKDFYLILRGGAGTGKSVFLSQKALIRLTQTPKMRGYAVRKVGKDIEGSIYKEFENRIYEYGLEDEWIANKTKHSFYNTRNGSELITFHMEDERRTKSIVEAEFIWVEEMDQLTVEDWDQLSLRLRGKAIEYKQIMGSFNPTDENSWIRTRFFPPQYEPLAEFALDFSEDDPLTGQSVSLRASVLQTTFRDNKFLTAQDRARYEALKHSNPKKYRIYVQNEWGKAEIELPWLFNFSDVHVSQTAVFDERKPLILSFDFNIDPMVITCHHLWFDAQGHHWHTFDEIVLPNGSVPQAIQVIKQRFPERILSGCIVTGDATSLKRDINQIDHRSSWMLVKQGLGLSDARLKVPRSNPSVASNRELCNFIAYAHPDMKVNPKCKTLLYELRYTEAGPDGDIPKKNRNKLEQRADGLDTWRYVANTFMPDFIDKTYKYKKV
jgi:hypothetical protein